MDICSVRHGLKKKIWQSDRILVGFGGEWHVDTAERQEQIKRAAGVLKELLAGKDYFVITTLTGEDIRHIPCERTHMTAPLDVSFTEEEWETYLRWLSFTLNKRTLLLELGEDLLHPNMIRWPFERAAGLNEKAYLYRINQKLPQITEELAGRAVAVRLDSVEFFSVCSEAFKG